MLSYAFWSKLCEKRLSQVDIGGGGQVGDEDKRGAIALRAAMTTAIGTTVIAAVLNVAALVSWYGPWGRFDWIDAFSFAATLGAFAAVAYASFRLSLRPNPVVDVSEKNLPDEVRSALAKLDPAASELLAKMEDHYRQSGEHRNELVLIPSTRSRNSYLLPRDAASLESAIVQAVRKTAAGLAPSNFSIVLAFLLTMAVLGWLGLRLMFRDLGYHPFDVTSNLVFARAEVDAALIIADQLVKGMLVDFVEFFRIEFLCGSVGKECYQLPYEQAVLGRPGGAASDGARMMPLRDEMVAIALFATVVLLTLRTIPALIFFKGYQSYQQRVTLERFLLQTVGRTEDEVLRARPRAPNEHVEN